MVTTLQLPTLSTIFSILSNNCSDVYSLNFINDDLSISLSTCSFRVVLKRTSVVESTPGTVVLREKRWASVVGSTPGTVVLREKRWGSVVESTPSVLDS